MTAPHPAADAHAPADGPGEDQREEIERLLGAVARATIEVLAGSRPVTQLRPLVAPSLVDRLHGHRGSIPPTELPRLADLGPIEAAWPSPEACEATVLFKRGARMCAMALRIERRGGRWRLVEAATPEMGRPLAAGAADDAREGGGE